MYHLVEGLQVPASLAGEAALEICNTRAGWGEASPKEYLRSYEHLVVWAREKGLVGRAASATLRDRARDEPGRAAAVLRQALTFRDAYYRVLVGTPAPRHREVVAGVAERASRLRRLSTEAGRTQWRLDEERAGLLLPLLAVGLAAGDWLCRAEPGSAAACPGTGCGWVFADPSRRRRWCSMAACGNRAKARRHAVRARTGTQG
ncbi:MAG: CGNR zinc finger domain-containing protein [Actinomycetes bacterium]